MAKRRASESANTESANTVSANAQRDDVDGAALPLLSSWRSVRALASFHLIENQDKIAFSFVIAVAAGIILPFLGSTGFYDPWESHYAEVARQMVARDDFLYPFWKDAYFFSKPILLFWLTAPLYALIGAGSVGDEPLPAAMELMGRLPVALIGLFSLAMVYVAARRLWGVRAAVLSGVVLATIPFWGFMSRQAITDMLYVGPMSAAICLLAVAFLDDDTRDKLRDAKIPLWMTVVFGLMLLPQLWEIGRSGAFLNRNAMLGSEFNTRLAVSLLLTGGAVAGLVWLRKKGSDPLLHAAAALVALATLGKGPHAVALTGMVFFFYLLATGEWKWLRRPAFVSALVLYFAIAMPWYVVMYFFDGKNGERKTWFQRFILHDLFGRLGGVHGNRGTFEYYVQYLAYGLFPWSPVFPVALFQAALKRLKPMKERTKQDRFTLLVAVWAISFFVFFTATSTKFHHYIFPLAFPGALLIGRWLDELLDARHRVAAGLGVFIALFVAIVGRDFIKEPWQLADLYSYHYVSYKPEYYFPHDMVEWAGSKEFTTWMLAFSIWTAVCFGLVVVGLVSDGAAAKIAARLGGSGNGQGGASPAAVPAGADKASTPRGVAALLVYPAALGRAALSGMRPTMNGGFVLMLLVSAFAFQMWAIQGYQNIMSQHWSHRWIINTYYQLKNPGEPLMSYQMDWKGETLYTHNTEIQNRKSAAEMKKFVQRPGREFVLVQQDRFGRLQSAVGPQYKDKLKIVDRDNVKWYLVLIEE